MSTRFPFSTKELASQTTCSPRSSSTSRTAWQSLFSNSKNVKSTDSSSEAKSSEKSSSRCTPRFLLKAVAVLVAVVATMAVYTPGPIVAGFLLLDFFTPWSLWESPTYNAYHDFIMDRLPEIPERPVPELIAGEFTREDVIRLSEGFTFPIIVRGALKDSTGVQNWGNRTWWEENYGDEEVLCKGIARDDVYPFCTMKEFFQFKDSGNPRYISTASSIFSRNPEMYDMVNSNYTDLMTPSFEGNKAWGTQMFVGWPGQGSAVHNAIGVNLFRQIAGSKKWYFMPPDQYKYLKPAINKNGISIQTDTVQSLAGGPLNGEQHASPYFKKVVRYSATVHAGDALINPPWYWHAVENVGDEMVVGVPSRYGEIELAYHNSKFMTAMAVVGITRRFGSVQNYLDGQQNNELVNGRDFLERSIAENRMKNYGEIEKQEANPDLKQ